MLIIFQQSLPSHHPQAVVDEPFFVDLFLDAMLANLDDVPEFTLQDTEDDLHAGVDVRTTLPTSCEPIKTMSGMGIEGNGKDGPRIN